MKAAVYAINWTEYERGWGQRPDGHTLHLTEADAKQYIKDYWDRQPKNVPDDYSAPETPKLVAIDTEAYEKMVEHYSQSENKNAFWGHVRAWI